MEENVDAKDAMLDELGMADESLDGGDANGIIAGAGDYEEATCKRVASLEVNLVPDEQIKSILFLEGQDLLAIRRTAVYLQERSTLLEKEVTTSRSLADNYDQIELRAQKIVMKTLSVAADPRFAASVMIGANKALRHGRANGQVPGQVGSVNPILVAQTTTIQLPQSVQQSIQNGTIQMGMSTRVPQSVPLKDTQLPAAQSVTKFLDPESKDLETPAQTQHRFQDMLMQSVNGGARREVPDPVDSDYTPNGVAARLSNGKGVI